MNKTIIIHTENFEKLQDFFKFFNKNYKKNEFSLFLNCKGYYPWQDQEMVKEIQSFSNYYAYPTNLSKTQSIVELVLKTKTEEVIIIDEDNFEFELKKEDLVKTNFLYTERKKLLTKNLDTNYQTIKWFLIDTLSQIKGSDLNKKDDSIDSFRYNQKINDKRFFERIIYVDGGIGDHVMALPFLEKNQEEIHVCCKYDILYKHLNFKSFISWGDSLFGGYRKFVYEYGSSNNSPTIIDAFFGINGEERDENDKLIYNGKKTLVSGLEGKKIALICSSAAKIQGLESNKDWKEVRWLKLVHELQKQNYFVIQVGTKNDNQIPRVNMKFLDKPIEELSYLISVSNLWITVDTFFHHFAASIKPEVGICLTPFYNDHAKHPKVTYIEKDCGKNYSDRRWWMDLQQPERKECMELITVQDVVEKIKIDNETKIISKINVPKTRFDIINSLIEKHNYKSYLEIGVYNPDGCFNKINCEYKVSVDSMVNGEFPVMFKMTSDDFFKQNTEKFDLIFIDGLHLDEQVQKDISNSFNFLNENGTIVLHDCNPPTHYHARENYYDNTTPVGWDWNGTVWKAIVKERCNNPNIFTSVVDTDWGVGIMQKSNNPNQIENLNPEFLFEKFAENRKYYLNLITPEEFVEEYLNEKKKTDIEQIRYSTDFKDSKKKIKIKIYCNDYNFDNCSNWRGRMQYNDIDGVEIEFSNVLDFDITKDINYNIIVMIRPLVNLIGYIRNLKDNGVKVVIDYDDSFPLSFSSKNIVAEMTEVLQIINECDALVTTTERLKHYYYYHSYNENINVMPNVVDKKFISEYKKDNNDKIVLGWFGNSGHYDNLKLIDKTVLKILDEYPNVYLNLYSDSEKIFELFKHPKTNNINYEFNFENFQEKLGEIDINLAPLTENYFSLHKSNIRIILSGYKTIPSIATNFGEYKLLGKDNVILCDSDDDWYYGLKRLIEDNSFRIKIGNNIKNYIENNLVSEKWKKNKYEMFASLIEKN